MKKIIRKMKRNRRYRNGVLSKFILILASLCIILIVFAKNGARADAADEQGISRIKTFAKYTIDEGDTLWELALTYGNGISVEEYIEEVMNINHLGNEDYIVAGKILVIPYYHEADLL